MSKVDVTTVVIVVVLVAALVFLGFQLYKLYSNQDPAPAEPVQTVLPGDTLPASDLNTFPEDDDFGEDTTSLFDEPLEPEPGPGADEGGYEAGAGESGEFIVIAGAFVNKDGAEAEASRLRGLGYPNAQTKPFDKRRFHVIVVDYFDSESRARDLAKELRVEQGFADAYYQKKRLTARQN